LAEADTELRDSIAALWADARERVRQRLAILEEAVAALIGATLDDELRDRARGEAHKLAGALGTFGMPEGSEHARALEHRLDVGVALADAPALAEHVTALRRIVDAGPGEDAGTDLGAPADVALAVAPELASAIGAALARRGLVARTGQHSGVPAVVALAADAETVARLAASGSVVAGLLGPGADRVELARRGAARLLPGDLAPDAIAAELADLAAARREATGRIVTVDDDPAILARVQAVLAAAGHEVTAVEDPTALWATLERAQPAILLLDIDMPEVDGISLCRAVRADPRWSALPILFLTAHTEPDVIAELFAAGADDYVPKPFAGPELAARVENRLERARLVRVADTTDATTKLELRRPARTRLDRLARHAERLGQPLTLALLRIDLPRDWEAADAALAAAGGALRATLGPEAVAARWGENELLVGLLGLDEHDARALVAEVLEALRPVTGAGGVAEHPRDGQSLDEVMAAARGAATESGRVRGPGADETEPDAVDVVLVDDDEVLSRLILHALQTRGYRTTWIADGDDAAQRLGGTRPPVRAPLVLLDWDLPGRDGLTVLRGLAGDGGLRGRRVIMLTGRASEREVLAALELGAHDHIGKPVSVPVLMQKVRRAMERT